MQRRSAVSSPEGADGPTKELSGLRLQHQHVCWVYVVEQVPQVRSIRAEEEELRPEAVRLFAIFVILCRGRPSVEAQVSWNHIWAYLGGGTLAEGQIRGGGSRCRSWQTLKRAPYSSIILGVNTSG